MNFKILAVGEILWDLLPSGKQLGGAPANFAYHAHALGAEARVVSRVGDDPLGLEILNRLRALDPERPRYLMGVGTPKDLLFAIGTGVDMFDCVLPTRNARNGQALTRFGKVAIKQARYATDMLPLDPACTCACCAVGYSRAYLRHLFMSREILVLRLFSLHNLHFYGELMAGARRAIEEGRYAAFCSETLAAMEAP